MSVKLQATSSCFHREHSPEAYALIDSFLASLPESERDFRLDEHESGPEVVVYLAVVASALSLAKSVIDLVVVIINARRAGMERGDRHGGPIELRVRRIVDEDRYFEETALSIGHRDALDGEKLQSVIEDAARRLFDQRDVD